MTARPAVVVAIGEMRDSEQCPVQCRLLARLLRAMRQRSRPARQYRYLLPQHSGRAKVGKAFETERSGYSPHSWLAPTITTNSDRPHQLSLPVVLSVFA